MTEEPKPKSKFSFDQKVAVISAIAGVASVGLAVLSAPFVDRAIHPEPASTPPAVYVVPQQSLEEAPVAAPTTPPEQLARPTSRAVPTTKAPSGTIDKENGRDEWLQERANRPQVAEVKFRTPISLLAARGDVFVVPAEGGGKRLLLASDQLGEPMPVGQKDIFYATQFKNDGDIDLRTGPGHFVYRRSGEKWEGCVVKTAKIDDVVVRKIFVAAHATVRAELTLGCFGHFPINKTFPDEAAGRLVFEAYPGDEVFPGETQSAEAKAPN